MKRVLLVATVQSHIAQFHKPLIKMLKEKGNIVDVAAKNNLGEKNGLKIEGADNIFDINFSRSPFNKNNIEAYKQLKNIMKKNKYDIVHCNTPMGGVITRLVKRNNKDITSKIIYTAHGFHFFKGAPLVNWFLYYPVEKYLSKYTDCLITMNKEDYEIAKRKFKAKDIKYTHGVGLNTEKFSINMNNDEKEQYRKNIGINKNDFVIIYVAELINRKNHKMILNIMKKLQEKKDIKLILVGNGVLEDKYKNYIKENKLENTVKMLGYCLDVPQLMKISDIAISTSKQEGLPVNVMEAMYSGLPDIVTDCRGNRDLIEDKENGYVIEVNDEEILYNRIMELYRNKDLRIEMGNKGIQMIKDYEIENVIKELKEIYESI